MKEKSKAALKIQTLWRGHRERSQLLIRQQVAQQVHAAIKIQRAVSYGSAVYIFPVLW